MHSIHMFLSENENGGHMNPLRFQFSLRLSDGQLLDEPPVTIILTPQAQHEAMFFFFPEKKEERKGYYQINGSQETGIER